ncbi:MAG: ubiquinol-cytochrome c reductase iron-sulfur subunit [Proteobacteria bacterium]|nr:ubiquinol-cytochrome c reductase iron-sulfur subunit [Pseudomonadota bacterium]
MTEKNATPFAADNIVTEDEKIKRRRLLLGVTGVVGGVSVAVAATPFMSSLRPSKKARAAGAPIKINIAGLKPGELRRDVWRLKPVWVFGRDQEMLQHAKSQEEQLTDPASTASVQPAYCQNENRSIKENIFVAIGLCTHLGCSPGQATNKKEGFLCACHGSRFDVAGRVFGGSPAPDNLIIPPHRYSNDDEIVIGEDDSA